MLPELDDVDRAILHLLQVDARNSTAREMAEAIGVSASTVRNRIEQLEADGVLIGYHPEIDYETAGLPLRVLFVVTAPPTVRKEKVEALMEIQGVVDVRETLTGRENVYVQVAARSTPDVTRMTNAIHELGLEIERSDLLKQHRVQPLDQFGHEGDVSLDDRSEVLDFPR